MGERISRDVVARGVRLRVTEEGTGRAVVLLHSLLMDHSTWDAVGVELGDGFHRVAPDLPGFGESEKPATSRFPYRIDAFAEAVADVWGALGLGRAALVGHGIGGAIAIALAAKHPELVSRLVLIDALCHPGPPDFQARIAGLPILGGFLLKQVWGKIAFRTHFRRVILSPKAEVADERIDRYYEIFNSPAARGSALATLRATSDTRPVVANTTRIETPTLVLWGRGDKVYPAALGQRLSREIRGARFELLDTGHAPQEEHPAEVAVILRRFFDDEAPKRIRTPTPRRGGSEGR